MLVLGQDSLVQLGQPLLLVGLEEKLMGDVRLFFFFLLFFFVLFFKIGFLSVTVLAVLETQLASKSQRSS